jgi:hypothetical protein
MAMDFSWLSSAEQYLKLYEKTVAEKAAESRQQAADSTQSATEGGIGKQKAKDRRKRGKA